MDNQVKKTILLIDDDPSLLVTLGDFLTFEGYSVVTADSGEAGLERLKSITPDLIILDMSMPGMGGVGFLKEISDLEGKPEYPVLVLTARANMAEFFANVAVEGFIAKPCNPDDLLMEVSRIIFLRSGEEQEEKSNSKVVKSVKLLVGEDDATTRGKIIETFKAHDYITDSVENGPEVLEKAIVGRPDVIVIKRILAGMNGDAVAGLLKEMPNTKAIPVVLYDEEGHQCDASDLTRSGSSIRKYVPCDAPAILLKAVREVLAAK